MKENLKTEYKRNFQDLLKNLNNEQKIAVETIDGPVVVSAGPGTGKTQILTLRIANILHKMGTEFAPNILALTFTDAGVKAMRQRLLGFIGSEESYEVGIYTFHSFCGEQIKKYPEFFQRISFSQPVSEIEQLDIIDEILEKGIYKKIKTFSSDFHHTKKILQAISELKSEAISPEKYEKTFIGLEQIFIDSRGEEAFYKKKYGKFVAGDLKPKVLADAQKEVEKQKELLDIYQKYQNALTEKKLFDFNDMILRVVEEAEQNKDFLERIQEQFLYILVDEHQDTNNAQNRLIELICAAEVNEGKPNIFTVGDRKQAIYKFQGASIEEFEKIKKKYKNVKIINLKNNYRSSQNILDTAHALISDDEKLEAKNEEFSNNQETIKIAILKKRKEELIFLAEEILKKVNQKIDLNKIAVFFRNNKEAEDIADIFEKYKIPYKLFTQENIINNQEIKKFILLLKAVDNPYNDEVLGKVLFIDFLNLNPLVAVKILTRLAIRKGGLKVQSKSVYKIISSEEILKSLDISEEEIKSFLNFAVLLKELKQEENNKVFLDFLNHFVNTSGFLKHIFSRSDNLLSLVIFEKIFNIIKEQTKSNSEYNLKIFLRYIEVVKTHDLKLSISENELKDGVNLMTVHKSKGLEFDYVYITNLIQEKWSGKRFGGLNFLLPITKAKSDLEDERRLFYVAITRARKELVISYSEQEEGKKKNNEPSIFLQELDDNLLSFLEIKEKSLEEKAALYFQEKTKTTESIFNKEYLKKLFLQKTLSVSALNNYKKSPILYFFRNLIQLPSGEAKPLIFGNIIHNTLEQFFAEKGKLNILDIFEKSLEKSSIPEKYFDSIFAEGQELLNKYVEKYQNDFVFENIYLEKNISRIFELKDKHILRLTGFIDKIEQKGDLLTVIDYKTGYDTKQKRKKAEQDLRRQLVFYKFLLDGDKKIPGVVEKGVLDFVVEMKEEKDLVKQIEYISDQEVEDLKKEINDFAEDIISGAFLEREYDRVEFEKENKFDKELFDLWELLKK